jgi:hypothetical protein
MKKLTLTLALAALSLSAMTAGHAATTPDGTMKDFLTAMQKRDRKTLRNLIDWPGLANTVGMGKNAPDKNVLIGRLKVIYVESFALGKGADIFKNSPAKVKGAEAVSVLMKQNPPGKQLVPATQFKLHKQGKNWLIYSITAAKK